MKRARNLFDDILAWDNLQKSLWSAAKGKRDRAEVVGFLHDVQQNLLILQQTLRDQTFDFSRYRQFRIRDPKPRMITAPCFESRIAHHAIISVLDPFFERFAIDHSYACRIGKGRNAAILAAQRAAKQSRWYVKLDIRSCFDSIQHEILLKLLCKRFKDPELLKMLSRVVQSFAESVGCGLPIGALTSQHFANFYLGWMDHHIVHELRPKSYVRYMDDFVMWDSDRSRLLHFREEVAGYLNSKLKLSFKRNSDPQLTSNGMNYLGCQVFPFALQLNRRNRRRISRRIRALTARIETNLTTSTIDQQRLTSAFQFSTQPCTVPLRW